MLVVLSSSVLIYAGPLPQEVGCLGMLWWSVSRWEVGGQPSRMGWDLLNNFYLLNIYSLFKKVFSLYLSLCFQFSIVLWKYCNGSLDFLFKSDFWLLSQVYFFSWLFSFHVRIPFLCMLHNYLFFEIRNFSKCITANLSITHLSPRVFFTVVCLLACLVTVWIIGVSTSPALCSLCCCTLGVQPWTCNHPGITI